MNKPKVSVIIPVYNAEKYLGECLDSVLNQTLKDIEVVCVNDGSTDNSLNILKKYQKKYKNIKIINQKNGGVISARIAGYNATSGEYIGWIDNDDIAEKNMFEILYNEAITKSADVVYCNYNFYPTEIFNKKKWFNEFDGQVTWNYLMNNTLLWNKLVSKKLLDFLNFAHLLDTQGEGCYGIILINAKKIVSINKCLYNYRVGHTSLSSNYKNIKYYRSVAERTWNMYNYVLENNYDDNWIEYYKYRYLYYNLILMIVSAYSSDKAVYKKSQKIVIKEELFGKAYNKYMKKSFSKVKRIFLYFGSKSYLLMRFMSKKMFN